MNNFEQEKFEIKSNEMNEEDKLLDFTDFHRLSTVFQIYVQFRHSLTQPF